MGIRILLTSLLASLLLLAALQGVALADNTSSVNLLANGSFDTPGASSFALADGWQALNPWGSVTVGLETGRKYAPYEIRGAGGPRGDKPRKWHATVSSLRKAENGRDWRCRPSVNLVFVGGRRVRSGCA